MCVRALCDFCPCAPWGGMAPCWLVHRAHLLYDNYPRHPSAQQGSYLPLWGSHLCKHTHTHKHYITTVSHCWMRLAIAWSLYTHPHTQAHHYAAATDGMSHLGHAALRWGVVEYFTDDALVSEWERSHEPHCVQADRVWPMFFPLFLQVWCKMNHFGLKGGSVLWGPKHKIYGHLLAKERVFCQCFLMFIHSPLWSVKVEMLAKELQS